MGTLRPDVLTILIKWLAADESRCRRLGQLVLFGGDFRLAVDGDWLILNKTAEVRLRTPQAISP